MYRRERIPALSTGVFSPVVPTDMHVALTYFLSGKGKSMLVREAVEDYKYAILRHAPRKQKWYLQILDAFVEWCEQERITLGEIRQSHIRRFIEEVRLRTNPKSGNPISSSTVNGYARVIKTFFVLVYQRG
jgi:hypothetical protein